MVTPLPPDAAGAERRRRRRFGRRSALLVLVLAIAASAAAVTAWRPEEPTDHDRLVAIGKPGDFPTGSITELVVAVTDLDPSRLGHLPVSDDGANVRLIVVNDPEVGLLALSGHSPFRGCRVVEIEAAEAEGFGHTRTQGFERGFLDPCHGGLFALDGTHLAGPGEQDLVRFSVARRPNGSLTVDLTRPLGGGSGSPVP